SRRCAFRSRCCTSRITATCRCRSSGRRSTSSPSSCCEVNRCYGGGDASNRWTPWLAGGCNARPHSAITVVRMAPVRAEGMIEAGITRPAVEEVLIPRAQIFFPALGGDVGLLHVIDDFVRDTARAQFGKFAGG